MASPRIPHNLLGLDPLLRVFAKLYIGDVLRMEMDAQLKGVYYYKNHPIQRIDVMGVVVKVQQNQRLIKYFLDDGTGVIPVICWKKELSHDENHWLQDIPACLAVLLDGSSSQEFQLGDLIHAQGKIREFHEQREISSFSIRKCSDPMEEVVRMAELPDLYTKLYDKPFQPPAAITDQLHGDQSTGAADKGSVLLEVENLIQDSFTRLKGDRFVPNDLMQNADIRQALVKAEVGVDSGRDMVEQAVRQLEVKGFVFSTQQRHFRVVTLCRELEKKILSILTEECQNSRYSGCHVSRVYDILRRQVDFSKVTKVTVESCLATLESRSDVISTSNCHYIAFGT